ncbi:OmpP1/FadL family transporter [Pontibacter arcticus]|uniref:Outer membrane protein transport protein (OMPP1/FadL/TodX) n=1 Tax=Pontibacter arcticus TaxID=2080288 RepID=A0A364RIM8_9BACT|nr:hypothetical protein [Pontibacter arcticus]RAU84141.1 hypothetical protein DP923_03595 [Pontibacter arcticus]
MINKKILSASLALLLGWSGTAFAQSEVDALRYSRLGITGSARILGMGGTQTALGADISAMNANPAGLGMFRRSEASFTPAIQFGTTDASTGAGKFSTDRNTLAIPSAGFVLSNRKGDDDPSDWRGVTFGVSLSQINNFNQQVSYQNRSQAPNTIVDYFADRANNRRLLGANETLGRSLDDEFDSGFTTYEGLAYGTYLIDVFEDAQGQYAEPLYTTGISEQQEQIKRRGSQNQYDFGVGTSYKDRLYLGASVGVVTSYFKQENLFSESGNYVATFDANGNPGLQGQYNLSLRDEFTSRGTGINLRVGVIARPIDALRIGVSIQTPTAYTFTDDYQTSLTATTLNPATNSPETITEVMLPGQFTYNLTTPFRANGGVAVFVSKYGFITADIGYVNYSKAKFREQDDEFVSESDYFDDVNNAVSSTSKSAINYSLGAEGRYDVFRFRAGYAVNGDPYRNANFDGKVTSYSLGAGIRLQNYYLDAAFVSSKGESLYSPYTFSGGGGEPVIGLDQKQNKVAVTFGFNF